MEAVAPDGPAPAGIGEASPESPPPPPSAAEVSSFGPARETPEPPPAAEGPPGDAALSDGPLLAEVPPPPPPIEAEGTVPHLRAPPVAEPSLRDAMRALGAAVRRESETRIRAAGAGLAGASSTLVAGTRSLADRARARAAALNRRAGVERAPALADVAASPAALEPSPVAGPTVGDAEAAGPAAAVPRRRRRVRAPGTRTIRWGWRLLLWSIFLLVAGAAAAVFAGWMVMRDLPLADILPPLAEPTISVETADGQVLTTQGAYQAPYVGLDEFPPHLVQAVMAIEDKRFYEHAGVDFRGISRALYRNASAGGVVEGGSTITQQLVKILYLEPERTISRKLQEAVLATTLERQLGKDRVLELYLNSVYLGSGAYGMPAAAETYFGKDIGELTLPEAATLAASIQLPSQVNPIADLGAVQNRGALVLTLMAEQGRIDEATRDQALAQLATLAPEPSPTRGGSYFADWVLDQVKDLEGASSQGLTAMATLDTDLQAETERIVRNVMAAEGAAAGASQAAVVVMTPSGRVRAMVGGLDYEESEFNRATDAMRQPGSTFKTFVFMAALVMGASPDNTVSDAPIEIGDWTPENFDGQSHGTVTLRQAFAKSYNQATVRLAQAVGTENIVAVAERFGIEAELRATPALALGSSEVTLLDMTEAFAALALGRMPVNATGIETLRFGEEGEALGVTGVNDREQTRLTRTREPMIELLRAVVQEGTGQAAAIEGLDLVGKTCTSQESRDAWFIGFAQGQGVVIGVWVGNDDNAPMDRVTGGGLPARIFREVMLAALAQEGLDANVTATAAVSAQPTEPLCDIRACSAAYRSFDASDCTYQPFEGPRRLCTR